MTTDGGFVLAGIDQTTLFHMMAQRSALRLEATGIRFKGGRSVLGFVKQEYNLSGNREKVLTGLEIKINELKAKMTQSQNQIAPDIAKADAAYQQICKEDTL